MKRENIFCIIIIIALIVIVPFALLFYWIPLFVKAFFLYISDKSDLSFSEHLTTVRLHSRSFNKSWREAAAKGIYVD